MKCYRIRSHREKSNRFLRPEAIVLLKGHVRISIMNENKTRIHPDPDVIRVFSDKMYPPASD